MRADTSATAAATRVFFIPIRGYESQRQRQPGQRATRFFIPIRGYEALVLLLMVCAPLVFYPNKGL